MPALDQLRERDIPLVLVSSKTLAELEQYRRQLRLQHPVVAENGAVMQVPDNYFADSADTGSPSTPRNELQAAYAEAKVANGFDCEAFYELGVHGIVRETGLAEQQATLANDRAASEPILWRDSDARAQQFEQLMRVQGLRCVRGGRFLHLLGDTGKEDAVRQLVSAYARGWPGECLTSVSLGDGPNDLGMLSGTDIAVIIPGKHGRPMQLAPGNRVIRPASAGPAGWNEAMLTLLKEHSEGRLATHGNGG